MSDRPEIVYYQGVIYFKNGVIEVYGKSDSRNRAADDTARRVQMWESVGRSVANWIIEEVRK